MFRYPKTEEFSLCKQYAYGLNIQESPLPKTALTKYSSPFFHNLQSSGDPYIPVPTGSGSKGDVLVDMSRLRKHQGSVTTAPLLSKRTPTYPLFRIPQASPFTPKWKEFRNINCWFWVWGMFQGYVGHFLHFWIPRLLIFWIFMLWNPTLADLKIQIRLRSSDLSSQSRHKSNEKRALFCGLGCTTTKTEH